MPMNTNLVLGKTQESVVKQLGPILTRKQYYLGGGTAVALHMKHRRSVDLDWFIKKPMGNSQELVTVLRNQDVPLMTHRVEEGTILGIVRRIRVGLMEYRYPHLQPLVWKPGLQCRLASLRDLAAMKLSAIAQRGAKKDFVDLYALGRGELSLRQMLSDYQRKFGVQDIGHVLCSLVYFDDANRHPMPCMLWRVDWRTIKKTIADWVRRESA